MRVISKCSRWVWITVLLALAGVSGMNVMSPSRRNQVAVGLVGVTHSPDGSLWAQLSVTNGTSALIACEGYGYLEPGEVGMSIIPVPPGVGAWRASIRWHRRDLGWFDGFMNHLRHRCEIVFGEPEYHRDPWFPLGRVSYSAEIPRSPGRDGNSGRQPEAAPISEPDR